MNTGVFSWQELLAPLKKMRPLIAGIVNATTDSFSDGNGFVDPNERTAFALKLLDEGADIIDLGGESTRPGAAEVEPDVEWERIKPVLQGVLTKRPDAVISIDTRHAETAGKALQAGARIINDVSGMMFDRNMAQVIADSKAGCILTHSAGIPEVMQKNGVMVADNTLETVRDGLRDILSEAAAAGIKPHQIMLDVGIGFGKTRKGNYELLHHAGNLENEFDLPFCWGVSRKSLLKSEPDSMEKRIAGSLALAVKLAENNVSLLRVHDVAVTLSALAAAREFELA